MSDEAIQKLQQARNREPQYALPPDALAFAESHGEIRTEYVHPPIPTRSFDWIAWRDGEEEDGTYGRGSTEAEAIADLRQQESDDEEPERWDGMS